VWNVNNQEGIHTYEVERSKDGKSFEKIAALSARNSENYSLIDETPFSGNNYYRIKAIARSNRGIYSNIVRVNLNETQISISTYPNPAKGNNLQISVSNFEKGNYHLNIYNAAGQKAATRQITYDGGSSMFNIGIESLAPGMYLMQLINEQNESIAEQKLIRQ